LLLPCCAVDQDWAAWDEHFDAGAELLEEARQAEPDIARTARLAGDLARAAEEPSRARQAYTLAWHQWAALERPAEASAIQARLASLPEADRPE
jgi:ABC-type nitrate/sulfonate/bicarbonate transport system substrate-binding protein